MCFWDEYRQRILVFLDINLVFENRYLPLEEEKRYYGTYKEMEGKLNCTVKLLNDNLVCDLIWPEIRILPVDDKDNRYFYMESFPIFLKFKEDGKGFIKELNLSGKRKKLEGKILYKV